MNQFKQAKSLICGSSRSRAGRMTDLILAEVLGIVQPIAPGAILAAGVVLALALGVVFVPETTFAATVPALPGFVPAPASLVAAAIAIRIGIRIRTRRSRATIGVMDAFVLLRRSP